MNCGSCHYFRQIDDPKAFAEDEGRCWSPWQERDTRSADQTCEHWAAREPERLAIPPSKRKQRREPYAFKPEGGQGHGWLGPRRARARY